jgi:FPC/CPF motif-containing protein YcgG
MTFTSPENDVDHALRGFLLGESFSCVGGKASYKRGALVHRHYGRLGDASEGSRLYADLAQFAGSGDDIDEHYATFMASFDGPQRLSEVGFEDLLWRELQLLHEIDRSDHEWAPGADSDPESAAFAYSVTGKAFFVVGLHPNSSRLTRRFAFPALVFNSHIQISKIRANGMYERMRRVIERKELELQGTLNPMLADFGDQSESRQYSGRAVERDWRCPFRPGA